MTDRLNVYHDGKGRNLMDWIEEKGKQIYTDVGKRTWRVPPVRFNFQVLKEQKLMKLENEQTNIRIDAPVLGQPTETDKETNRAESYVCAVFEHLSEYFVNNRIETAMFLISNFEYDCYLNKLSRFITEKHPLEATDNQTQNGILRPEGCSGAPDGSCLGVKLPKDVTNRGELDVLILHQTAGVILVQTKAVGYNFKNKSSNFERGNSVKTAVDKAGEQLVRDRKVMLHIMEDLDLKDEQITSLVALPNLSRKVLTELISPELTQKVGSEFNLDLDRNFLCEEDLKADFNGCQSVLAKWWREVLLPKTNGIDLQTMQQIAYRTVGLMSTVSVWSYAQPRIEVRNLNEAAWETGNRYTQVVLSPPQVEMLKYEDKYLYLWGPAGSGKTLLLSLKGRQWLRQGCNVAIINTRLGSRGRTVGQVIETTINKTEGLDKKVIRIDLDLMDNEETLSSIIRDHVKGQVFNFLLDEIAWVEETNKLLRLLKTLSPHSAIWCAGMLTECQPEGFTPRGLQVILRCPPSVQRVLRIVDSRDERCELYKLDSAKAGLSTDGLRPFFIIHSKHGDASIQPYDCPICATELSNILTNKLNMKPKSGPSTNRPGDIICPERSNPGSVTPDILGSRVDSGGGPRSFNTTSIDISDTESTPNQIENLCLPNKDQAGKKKPTKNKKNNNLPNGVSSSDNSIKKSGTSITENNHPSSIITSQPPTPVQKSRGPTYSDISSTKKQTKKQSSTNNQTQNPNSETKVPEEKQTAKKNPKKKKNTQSTNNQENQENTNIDEENNDEEKGKITSDSKRPKTGKKNKPNKRVPNKAATTADGATYPLLNFSDCVLPVTVPRAWHHYNKRGYWSISREALAQEMVLLGSRTFCKELYHTGVPLKVEEAMVMKSEGKELENNFVMCPLGAVHGLEYKLVVCVPSACELPECIEISEGIRNGNMEPRTRMKRTQFGANYLKTTDELTCEQYVKLNTDINVPPKIDKVRISTHVAEAGAPYDMLYEPMPEGDESFVLSDSEAASSRPHKVLTYTDEDKLKIKLDLCGHCDEVDKCVCQYFDIEELAAMHRLDDWNRAYVLMCASRCTSTLVLVLP